jgi:hypothetical protein
MDLPGMRVHKGRTTQWTLIILDRASCLYLIVRIFLVVIVSFEVAGSRAVRLVWVVLFLTDQRRISALIRTHMV